MNIKRRINKTMKPYFPAMALMAFFMALILSVDSAFTNTKAEVSTQKFLAADNSITFAQLSDVHIDSTSKNHGKRLLGDSSKLLQDAINQINSDKKIQFVVFSGDSDNKASQSDLIKFIKMSNNLDIPWYYALGNHDISINGALTKAKFIDTLKKNNPNIKTDRTYYTFSPKKNYLFIMMDGVIDNKITANGYFDRQQLDWLDGQLTDNPDKNIIIVQHFPVVEPYKSDSHRVTNAEEYFNILDKHKNVIAVLSGHYHATKITMRNNVVHISTPALIEYPDAFRVITLTDSKDNLKLDTKIVETRLIDLQQKSKSLSKSWKLNYGELKDRDASFVISKKLCP